jgi:hypothetical protein
VKPGGELPSLRLVCVSVQLVRIEIWIRGGGCPGALRYALLGLCAIAVSHVSIVSESSHVRINLLFNRLISSWDICEVVRWAHLAKLRSRVTTNLALKIDIFNIFLQPLRVLDSLKRCQLLQHFICGELLGLESLERGRYIYTNSSG